MPEPLRLPTTALNSNPYTAMNQELQIFFSAMKSNSQQAMPAVNPARTLLEWGSAMLGRLGAMAELNDWGGAVLSGIGATSHIWLTSLHRRDSVYRVEYSRRAVREMATLAASVEAGTLGILDAAKRAHELRNRSIIKTRNASSVLALLFSTLQKPVVKDFGQFTHLYSVVHFGGGLASLAEQDKLKVMTPPALPAVMILTICAKVYRMVLE
jgi:hypothetical protein